MVVYMKKTNRTHTYLYRLHQSQTYSSPLRRGWVRWKREDKAVPLSLQPISTNFTTFTMMSQRLPLIINILIPMLILTKLSSAEYLWSTRALVVALAFPIIYGLRERSTSKTRNWTSGLGIISVLLSGGIALLELPTERLAIKEAAIPALIGLGLFVSLKFRDNTLAQKMFTSMLDTTKIFAKLDTSRHHIRHDGLRNLTYRCMISFALSAVLNYALARYIVVSPAGTEAFNQELWRMTGLSFPVIALPATLILTGALMYFLHTLHVETGLEYDEMILQPEI